MNDKYERQMKKVYWICFVLKLLESEPEIWLLRLFMELKDKRGMPFH